MFGLKDQRRITVVGTPDAQWKAQWLIIEKLRTDGFTQGEWPIVTVELPIPVIMVGRIIGKQGKKVLELQRESHAIIEVPMANTLEDMGCSSCNKSASAANCAMLLNGMIHHADCKDNSDVMLVKLLGHFWALQVRAVCFGFLLSSVLSLLFPSLVCNRNFASVFDARL